MIQKITSELKPGSETFFEPDAQARSKLSHEPGSNLWAVFVLTSYNMSNLSEWQNNYLIIIFLFIEFFFGLMFS